MRPPHRSRLACQVDEHDGPVGGQHPRERAIDAGARRQCPARTAAKAGSAGPFDVLARYKVTAAVSLSRIVDFRTRRFISVGFVANALRERRRGYSVRSDGGDEDQMWALLYDDGTSLTTVSERIARSLAEAERQRGRHVTVRHMDDAETHPRGVEEPARPSGRAGGDGPVRPEDTEPAGNTAVAGADSMPEPEPASAPELAFAPELASAPELAFAPEPASVPELASAPEPTPAPELASAPEPASAPELAPAPEPAQVLGLAAAVEPTQTAEPASVPKPASNASPPELPGEPEPIRVAAPTRRRRLMLYALAVACIVIAAALIDHWGVLPRVGAHTNSSPTQVGFPHGPQLLPPLDQPPVMHFSNAVRDG